MYGIIWKTYYDQYLCSASSSCLLTKNEAMLDQLQLLCTCFAGWLCRMACQKIHQNSSFFVDFLSDHVQFAQSISHTALLCGPERQLESEGARTQLHEPVTPQDIFEYLVKIKVMHI